ncbi:Transposon Tn7 transposition protein tnsC [Cupriavidus basilensis]|uniref:Transposon Tn7 transposition protein tnsC n=2 Tax=Cupriavidus basilensis TaxID=68895 RepID=A0A0C4YWY9_9BURK|nr:Transposon Tn7 transposition protein tnsC [Cupriavidus basilensis]
MMTRAKRDSPATGDLPSMPNRAIAIKSEEELLEYLEELLDVERHSEALCNLPEYSPEERQLPKAMRMRRVGRLETFYQTLPRDYEVLNALIRCIINGYEYRPRRSRPDITETPPRNVEKLVKRSIESVRYRPIRFQDLGPTSAPMASLLGLSGLGKTHTIHNALTFIPQKVECPDGVIQVVWIYVQCSPYGQLKEALRDIILAIDNLAPTEHIKEVSKKAGTDELGLKVRKLCEHHRVGIIVFDEIQNALVQRGVTQHAVLNFFVKLNNRDNNSNNTSDVSSDNGSLIPIFFLGTSNAKQLLKETVYSLRRAEKYGEYEWAPCGLNTEWNNFFSALWEYQWTKKFAKPTPQLSLALHDLSQGIFGIATCLFQLAQIHAIEHGMEELTPKLLYEVFEQRMSMLIPVIEGIRNGDVDKMSRYEDIIANELKKIRGAISSKTGNGTTTEETPKELSEEAAKASTNYSEAKTFLDKIFSEEEKVVALRELLDIWRETKGLLASSALVQKVHGRILKERRQNLKHSSPGPSKDVKRPTPTFEEVIKRAKDSAKNSQKGR